MLDFIMLMHNDAVKEPAADAWPEYFRFLRERGAFEGGSSIGEGQVFRKHAASGKLSGHLAGYIRVQAESLTHAFELPAGNPVFECGGSVEIRALPRG